MEDMCLFMCIRDTDLSRAPDQTESAAVFLEALLLCQSCEENRQKEAKGSGVESRKWRAMALWLDRGDCRQNGGGPDEQGEAMEQ